MVHLFSIYIATLWLYSLQPADMLVSILGPGFLYKKTVCIPFRNFKKKIAKKLRGVTWTTFFCTVNFRLVSFIFFGNKEFDPCASGKCVSIPNMAHVRLLIGYFFILFSDFLYRSSTDTTSRGRVRRSRKQTNLRFCCLEFFKQKWSNCKGGRFTNTFH